MASHKAQNTPQNTKQLLKLASLANLAQLIRNNRKFAFALNDIGEFAVLED